VAEQATGTVASSADSSAGALAHPPTGHLEHNPGRPMSWVGVSVVIVGFFIGGAAFIPHPIWWLFWLGTGIAVLGCLMLAFTKTFNEDWY
jgi:hypothetical protein